MSHATNTFLIKQARILTSNADFFQGDLKIDRGITTEIAPTIMEEEGGRVIDATGLTLLPGVIDPLQLLKPNLMIIYPI